MAERAPRRRGPFEVPGDLDAIRDGCDRRRSFELLALLLSGRLDEDAVADVADALVALEDPRCAPALTSAALDPRRPFLVRAACVEILSATPADDPPPEDARAWARSHDPVVRALGIQFLDVPDAGLVAAAAGDPEPVVRRVALESMASLVRTPETVAAVRRALRDDDALVREAACRVALFDEPLECSWDLLRGLSDPSAVVRAAAFEALEWYPRVSVLLALADTRPGGLGPGPADGPLDALTRRVLTSVAEASPAARRRLQRWAGPVGWLLEQVVAARDQGSSTDPAGPRRRRGKRGAVPPAAPGTGDDGGTGDEGPPGLPRVDVALAARLLADPATPAPVQREQLARRSWARSGRAGLDVLRACAASPNWSVRKMTARPFAELGAWPDLESLAHDREPVVRRSALAVSLDLDQAVAGGIVSAARETLRDDRARPAAGDHALAVVAAFGGSGATRDAVLAELERPDDRDGLWLGAIHLARLAGIRAAVPELVGIAESPVISGVGCHVAAVQALRSLGRPRPKPRLGHLDGIDHLDVQRELGEWGWHGARWG